MLDMSYTKIEDLKPDELLRFVAEDQCWDKATLKQLREEHNVIFRTKGSGVSPIMIINRGSEESPHFLLAIGSEDDGCISFERAYGQFKNTFHTYWVKYLIADIEEALKVCEKKVGKKKN